ncbi:MAG: hypothetical protein DRG83_14275 [Deltaproteobacteria bacterium]|nr:MAG: hypothetical protein DRG83_14275 [Deltaproteobacteria bacterium]
MYNPFKALDTMVPTKKDLEAKRKPGQELYPTREEILAYQFKPGEVVRDKVTGKAVKILAADRAEIIKKGGD